MFVLIITILVSVWLFGLYAVIHIEDHQKKLQIHQKLIESIEEHQKKIVNDLHNI